MTSSFLEAIYNGEHDDDLDQIIDAVRARRDFVGKMVTSELSPGDTVRFSDRINPKYMIGLEATVVKLNRESVVVDCPDDPAYGRFQNHKRVRCPNELIEGRA